MRLPFREEPATYEETQEILRRMGELRRIADQAGMEITKVNSRTLLHQLRAERKRAKADS